MSNFSKRVFGSFSGSIAAAFTVAALLWLVADRHEHKAKNERSTRKTIFIGRGT